jgi:hypothetical protein
MNYFTLPWIPVFFSHGRIFFPRFVVFIEIREIILEKDWICASNVENLLICFIETNVRCHNEEKPFFKTKINVQMVF